MHSLLSQFYLRFSDGAKFADIARNLVGGLGYGAKFNFWGDDIFGLIKLRLFTSFSIPPVMPLSIATFFKVFGVNDFAVMATSFFYFILTLVFAFLLTKKIFKNNLTAVLSTLAIGFNYDIINYATSGASESPFIFEIVAAAYFISLKKWWADFVTILFFILLYFTRPQAFIYIAGLILFYLLDRFKIKKAILCFTGIMILGLLFDYFVLLPQSGQNFMYSVISRGIYTSFSQTSVASNTLRGGLAGSIGGSVNGGGHLQIIKNILYNLYNFYKLTPQIMSPYLFGLFVIGLFMWGKDPPSLKASDGQAKLYNSFKAATIFMFVITFLVAAASIPFYRYLHPIVPLIYIIAVGTLVELVSSFQFQTSKQTYMILISTFLILIFGVGQTLGIIFLDSRFDANTHNTGKPPVYVVLSKILKVNTEIGRAHV
jgi:4-amino-4-deoxy-L-arabinose transferase-like glycosyltransferase